MKVDKNKVVALSYTLTVDGAVADKAPAERPLKYIHGKGMLLPRFEEEVNGKEAGEPFEFTLSPEEGYGEHNSDYLIELPLSAFELEGKLREDLLHVGRVIPMMNQDGGIMQGTVKEVKAESVVMDFNHPMAGKTLHFAGTVESVREATEEELKNGLKHKCGCGKKKEGGCNCEKDECSEDVKCECNSDCGCSEGSECNCK